MSALQEEYKKRLLQRQQAIASLIVTLDLAHIDDQLLIGGLLFLKDKITIQDSLVEDWRSAGDRFLRWKKSKNSLSFISDAAPHKTNRAPQKQFESGGK